MVRAMVSLCAVLLFAWSMLAQAQDIKLTKQQLMLGESTVLSFFVTIAEKEGKTPVQQLIEQWDWSLWQKHFVITEEVHSERSLRLRLYPLRSGKIQLPEQRFAHMVLPALELWVMDNPEVTVAWQAPSNKAYWEQAWPWNFSVSLPHSAYVAEPKSLPTPEFLQSPAQQRIASQIEISERRNDNDQHIEWVAFQRDSLPLNVNPLTQVSLNIAAPVIEVRHNGGEPWRFVAPAQTINFQPLPSFLPNQVLIGDFSVQHSFNHRLIEAGELLYWDWRISGAQMAHEDYVFALRNWFAEQPRNSKFEWFSPTISVNGDIAEVKIPLRAKHSGVMALPEWPFVFFQPTSGKVERIEFDSEHVVSIPAVIYWLIYAMLWLLAVVLLLGLTLICAEVLWRLQWMKRLQQTQSSLEMWQTLQQMHRSVQTVAQVQNALQAKGARNVQWLEQLNQNLFAGGSHDFAPLRQQAIRSIWQLSWRVTLRQRAQFVKTRIYDLSWLNCWSKFFSKR